MAIILLGFMASGKTTLGKKLAEELDLAYIDLDQEIEKELGMTISEYFKEAGEESFRKIENQLLRDLSDQEAILATGGGIVELSSNRDILRTNNQNIYLAADFSDLYQRIAADKNNVRPLFLNNSKGDLEEIYQRRCPFYSNLAHLTVDVNRPLADIMPELVAYVREEDQ
ncbi:shikimate kinase [Streptococcaceae bacterium ESL0687]|nr:shikimate kinase [Streptococcaceae bacterium ESL0687]